MMNTLYIESDKETPEINCDGNQGIFSISGKSYPENVISFYAPVLEYLEQYKRCPAQNTILDMHWLYFNTATSKIIVKIILTLKETNTKLIINWYYKKDSDIIADKGKEIKEIMDVNINIIEL